jgi:hypothetical protein
MVAGAGYEAGAYIVTGDLVYFPPTQVILYAIGEATRTTSTELTLPSDAIIDRAVFDITADKGLSVQLGTVGDVRAGSTSTEVIVDFGGMTTVSSIAVDGEPDVSRWNGVEFVAAADGEIQTERIKLDFDAAVQVSAVAAEGRLFLPTVPTGLELLVDGTSVWFERQGNSAGLTPPVGSGNRFSVDRTAEVQQALARSGGPVRVELRSLTPGSLALNPSVDIHRVHLVAFPEGPSRTLTMPAEGPISLELPLPEASSGWTVDGVDLLASASLASERVVPPYGPTPSVDGRLALTAGRTVLGRLPAPLVERVGTLTGVRLALRGGDDGGEIGGRLLLDATPLTGADPDAEPRPGAPVPGGELTPVPIEAGDDPRWVTLRTAAPVGHEATWVELGLTYGTATWELTAADPDDDAPGTDVHLRRPGGAVRPLTTLADVGTLRGSLRIVTEPDDNRPIDALSIGIGDGVTDRVGLTPTTGGVAARFGKEGGTTVTAQTLTLTGAAAVAGAFTFADIRVTYREIAS